MTHRRQYIITFIDYVGRVMLKFKAWGNEFWALNNNNLNNQTQDNSSEGRDTYKTTYTNFNGEIRNVKSMIVAVVLIVIATVRDDVADDTSS